MKTTPEIKSIVIVSDLYQRELAVGELPGPYESEAAALDCLEPGQRYEVRDGVLYAEERSSNSCRGVCVHESVWVGDGAYCRFCGETLA